MWTYITPDIYYTIYGKLDIVKVKQSDQWYSSLCYGFIFVETKNMKVSVYKKWLINWINLNPSIYAPIGLL